MDKDKREFFKLIIIDHIKEVEEEISNIKQLCTPISPDNAIGRLSRMEAINEKSINEASLRKLELRILNLNEALLRAKSEDFGICFRCEEEIPQKRLKILPESKVCVRCLEED